ncbi:regulatory protein RecX [Nocardiopsis sp. N85]|uniref:regulatory protein RecX n=1 Tax=Nocardiopsis sp. N85 TaxID=3029400 RepID=UPI00237F2124|nr:regulatory protein RecX [Nocardiopsis sp. N85]MDE3720037.1 regulatory protein RecX [Nocardiopsis sp. N85]
MREPDAPPDGDDGPDAASASGGEKALNRARTLALRMLAHKPRTAAQLETGLLRRGHSEEVVTAIVEECTAAGLVDDTAFSRAWVSSRHHGRGLSRNALTRELRTRGVDEDTVREAVAELSDDDEDEAARVLARRSLAGSRGRERDTRVRRAVGVLARKGYGGGLAYRVVREELEAEGVETDPGFSGS